ncbi:MAG: rhomboid family intramembrane serine protease [Oscillospiraceae bacterium]|jgi:hypothetical protein|nr:rhomboid family intramembrane serine protease [Oscillospiraceae bacterium]
MMKWLSRLELRARSKFYISNLMYYIIGGMAVVFLLDMLGFGASNLFYLDMNAVMRGQVWRLVTFIFLPPQTSFIFIIIALYFYYMIGNALESMWGSFRFNLYYLVGMLGAIVSAIISQAIWGMGYADNTFLNMSLFLAFAAMNPNFQIMLMFLIPIKMKWLALFDVALYAWQFITGGWDARIAIVFSLANLILFFGKDAMRMARAEIMTLRRRIRFKSNYRR